MYLKKQLQHDPLCVFGECTANYCTLTRSNNPEYRNNYEECVSNKIVKTQDSVQSVQYADLGSNNMFSNLAVLARALQQKPYANITSHLIDTKYANYIKAHENRVARHIHSLPVKAKKNVGSPESTPPAPQLLAILSEKFPQARLNVVLHGSILDFIKYTQTYDVPFPHIFTMCDIEEFPEEKTPQYLRSYLSNFTGSQHHDGTEGIALGRDGIMYTDHTDNIPTFWQRIGSLFTTFISQLSDISEYNPSKS